jgi:hypothetical protein
MTVWRYSGKRLAELEAALLDAEVRYDQVNAVPRKSHTKAWRNEWEAARADWHRLYREVEVCRLALWRRERQHRRSLEGRTA